MPLRTGTKILMGIAIMIMLFATVTAALITCTSPCTISPLTSKSEANFAAVVILVIFGTPGIALFVGAAKWYNNR